MDRPAVLAAFDEQMRRAAVPGPGAVVEREHRLTRTVAADGSWAAVVWSDLVGTDVVATVAAQVERFAAAELEWKLYAHDRPADLPVRLAAAGFEAGPAETVLVADLRHLDLPTELPDGIHLAPVEDAAGADAMVAVHQAVFGGVHPGTREAVLLALAEQPRPVQAVVAYDGDVAVSAGRVEFHEGTEFASIWGGGTLPVHRGRGVFRALVARRAALARARGYRYLQVDAVAMSRPILERLGFVALTGTTPWIRAAGNPPVTPPAAPG